VTDHASSPAHSDDPPVCTRFWFLPEAAPRGSPAGAASTPIHVNRAMLVRRRSAVLGRNATEPAPGILWHRYHGCWAGTLPVEGLTSPEYQRPGRLVDGTCSGPRRLNAWSPEHRVPLGVEPSRPCYHHGAESIDGEADGLQDALGLVAGAVERDARSTTWSGQILAIRPSRSPTVNP
jgi:hypothetical protein